MISGDCDVKEEFPPKVSLLPKHCSSLFFSEDLMLPPASSAKIDDLWEENDSFLSLRSWLIFPESPILKIMKIIYFVTNNLL